MNTPSSEPDPSTDQSKRPAMKVTAEGKLLLTRLAKYYGDTEAKVAEAALILLRDHVEQVEPLQIQELTSSIQDLAHTVAGLADQAEHLERLVYEIAILEADRITR